MGIPLRVLIVEDSEDDTRLLIRQLAEHGYDAVHQRVEDPEAMRSALAGKDGWDVVVCDFRMPRFSAPAALEILKGTGQDLPFIIFSGSVGETAAVEAMRKGAQDYVLKDHPARLIPAIQRELREAAERRERKRAEEAVLHLAYHDTLTGFPNRALLQVKLQVEIEKASRRGASLALLLIDLDRFKEINDTLGHRHGDELLKQVGSRLREAIPPPALVARLGGDEFAVLLPGADESASVEAARRVASALESPCKAGDLELEIRSSIGIAVYPAHGADADQILRLADVAMYQAKGSASGCAVYDPHRDEHNPQRLTLLTDLRRAIDLDQLFLVYQPKVDLRRERLVGVEALVRWSHPQSGVVSPDQFVPLAERAGLIRPLTVRVLRAAVAQCREWRRQGRPLAVSVNLSVRDLEDPTLPEEVEGILRAEEVPPADLELEITEGSLMTDFGHPVDSLVRLHRMGVRISIDDFGTGFSSLTRLLKLPVSVIKIDKSFVTGMDADATAERIVRSIIGLGHSLSMEVVAEGVESREILDRLERYSCDMAQGYYLSRPLPAAEIAGWIAGSPWR